MDRLRRAGSGLSRICWRGGEGILSGDDENKKGPATGRAEAPRAVAERTSGFLLGGKSGVLDNSIGSSSTRSRLPAARLTGEGLFLFVLPSKRSAGSLATAGLGPASSGNPSRSEKSDNSNDSRKRFFGGGLSLRARFSTLDREFVTLPVTSSSAAFDSRLRGFSGSARVVARGGWGLDEMRLMTSGAILGCRHQGEVSLSSMSPSGARGLGYGPAWNVDCGVWPKHGRWPGAALRCCAKSTLSHVAGALHAGTRRSWRGCCNHDKALTHLGTLPFHLWTTFIRNYMY